MTGPVARSAAWPTPDEPVRMPATRAPRHTIWRVRPPCLVGGVGGFTGARRAGKLPVGAPRRHQTVHTDVYDQVAVVVHVVLDRAKDERPALHLLVVPALDQLLRLCLGERVPHLGPVVVARPELPQDLVARLELLEAVVARQRLAGHLAEEEVVLPDQVDEVLPERPHRGRRLEIVLVLRDD